MFSPSILSRAALRNTYARYDIASARICFIFFSVFFIPLLLSFLVPRTLRAPSMKTFVSAHQTWKETASFSRFRLFIVRNAYRFPGEPACLSPCSVRHPLVWTIQFLSTACCAPYTRCRRATYPNITDDYRARRISGAFLSFQNVIIRDQNLHLPKDFLRIIIESLNIRSFSEVT